MKTRWSAASACSIGLLCAVLSGGPTLGETIPEKGRVDARVRVATYRADEVYRLRGFVGYQIDLEFEHGESFVGLGAGDIEGLSFVAQDNHLFLKPKAGKIATNLTVLTTRRQYQFDYSSRPMSPGAEDPDVVFALRFIYPAADEAAKAAADAAKSAAAELESRLRDAAQDRPNNIDYWYCGSTTIKPVAASDDGVHTRLRFAAQSDLPAIFVRNDDGSESLLNFHLDAGDVILHRVARRFIVRRGTLTGCIVNQGYSGGGARLDSGTIAPEVRRATQESRP